jgi:hypothetical protein
MIAAVVMGIVGTLAPAALADGPHALLYNSAIFQPGGNDHLYQVDLSTGNLTDLGFVGADNIEGIDILPDGRIIGVDGYTDGVWEFSESPGQFIGQTGPRYGVDAGLSYDPVTGKLYNLNGADTFDFYHSWIYEIDPETGQATYVSQNVDIYVNGLAIDDNGVAYVADGVFTDHFFRMNLQTGAMTFVGYMNTVNPGSIHMDFDCQGRLWATTSTSTTTPDHIYTIDTTTGYATLVATFQWGSAGFRGLAILPQSPCNCPADLVADGVVDVSDFLLLLAAWGDTSGPGDIDGDGIVGVTDFLALLAAWGPCDQEQVRHGIADGRPGDWVQARSPGRRPQRSALARSPRV